MEQITAVLIDDEEHCTDMLSWLLEQYCPQVAVQQVFNEPAQALKYLQNNAPDVIFLDIEMPVLNAFDLLLALGDLKCDVVFTTAYDEFAIRAIKHSALDYLLKPVDKDELIAAVAKVGSKQREGMMDRIDDLLRKVTGGPGTSYRLAIPTREGLEMVDMALIVHAEADDNYTKLHLSDGRRILVSRTLKDVEKELPAKDFMRIHQSHVVALGKIEKYVRGSGGYVVLAGAKQVPVSRAKKDDLLSALGQGG